MAYGLKYQIGFKSRRNVPYYINIYKQGYSGSTTSLTPAQSPIVINEDADEDIFKVVRGQTGYVRILTDSQSVAEDLVPTTWKDHFVALLRNGTVLWQGYMQPTAFSIKWDGGLKEVEYPVASPLAILADLPTPISYFGRFPTMAQLLYYMFAPFKTPLGNYIYNYFYISNELYTYTSTTIASGVCPPLNVMYNRLLWVKETEMRLANGNVSTLEKAESAADVLEMALRPFGMILRESCLRPYSSDDGMSRAPSLFVDYPDISTSGDTSSMLRIAYDEMYELAAYSYAPSYLAISAARYALANYEYRGDGHQVALLQTARSQVRVNVDVDDSDFLTLKPAAKYIPTSLTIYKSYDSDGACVCFAPFFGSGTLYADGDEEFKILNIAYFVYGRSGSDASIIANPWTYTSNAGTMDMLRVSSALGTWYTDSEAQVPNAPLRWQWRSPDEADPWYSIIQDWEESGRPIVWGAVPVRWALAGKGSSWGDLRDGVMLNMQPLGSYGITSLLGGGLTFDYVQEAVSVYQQTTIRTGVYDWIYHFKKSGIIMYGGAFCINFELMSCFNSGGDYTDNPFKLNFNSFNNYRVTLYCKLKVGSVYWDGDSWDGTQYSCFPITFDGGRIVTNKPEASSTSSVYLDGGDEGYWVPATQYFKDVDVDFYIMPFCRCFDPDTGNTTECRTTILTNMEISLHTYVNPSYTNKDANLYAQTANSDAIQDEQVDLKYGTFNANVKDSPSFMLGGSTYWHIRSIRKRSETVSNAVRIEEMLLSRLATYHGAQRRKYKAELAVPTDDDVLTDNYNPLVRTTYNNKCYMAVPTTVDFGEDTAEVDFIEVSS